MLSRDWLRQEKVCVFMKHHFYICSGEAQDSTHSHLPTGVVVSMDEVGFTLKEIDGGDFWIPWGEVAAIEKVPEVPEAYHVTWHTNPIYDADEY